MDFTEAGFKENMRKRKWVANNGKILRAINFLRSKFTPLEQIRYGVEPNISLHELIDSINYLNEAGYIKLRYIDSKQDTTLADAEYIDLEAKLTSEGIKLLAGKISDDCVGR